MCFLFVHVAEYPFLNKKCYTIYRLKINLNTRNAQHIVQKEVIVMKLFNDPTTYASGRVSFAYSEKPTESVFDEIPLINAYFKGELLGTIGTYGIEWEEDEEPTYLSFPEEESINSTVLEYIASDEYHQEVLKLEREQAELNAALEEDAAIAIMRANGYEQL